MKSPLLVVDKDFLTVLLPMLDQARESVDLIAFSFGIGKTTSAPLEIANKLIEINKKRKLRVRVYLEGERETNERNRVTAALLKKAKIQVRFGATHAKGIRIDNRYVLFGSTNLTHQSITKNYETNLMFDDPAVAAGFGKYFEHLWKGGTHGGVTLSPPLIADGGFKDVLVDLISRAKRRLDFSIYFFHHTEIETALAEAAERGVHVRGLVHNHFSFAMSYVRRTRGTVKRLRERGLDDLHYGPPHLFTHSKFIVRDRREILLGTGNWLHEDVKVHPQLYVHFEDAKVGRQLSAHLDRTIDSL